MTMLFFYTWSDQCSVCATIICEWKGFASSRCTQTATHSTSAPWTATWVCLPDWEGREVSPKPHLMAHCPGLTSDREINTCTSLSVRSFFHQQNNRSLENVKWTHRGCLNNFLFPLPFRWPACSGLFCIMSCLEVVVAPKTFITLTFRKGWKIYSTSVWVVGHFQLIVKGGSSFTLWRNSAGQKSVAVRSRVRPTLLPIQ